MQMYIHVSCRASGTRKPFVAIRLQVCHNASIRLKAVSGPGESDNTTGGFILSERSGERVTTRLLTLSSVSLQVTSIMSLDAYRTSFAPESRISNKHTK